MTALAESIAGFKEPVYSRVKRNSSSYKATKDYVVDNLSRLVTLYRSVKNNEQMLRLIRDDIDNALRRYHQYCIKENIGSHYVERGLVGNGIFEHMVPNSTVRDLLLAQTITAEQACNMPTCKLSQEKDQLLRDYKWTSRTPDIYNFWNRYSLCFDTKKTFETYDGLVINPKMTLDDHFQLFAFLMQ